MSAFTTLEARRAQALSIASDVGRMCVRDGKPPSWIEAALFDGEIEPFVSPQPFTTKPSRFTTFDVKITFAGSMKTDEYDLLVRVSFVEDVTCSAWSLAYVIWEDRQWQVPEHCFPNGKPIPAFKGSTYLYV